MVILIINAKLYSTAVPAARGRVAAYCVAAYCVLRLLRTAELRHSTGPAVLKPSL